MTKYPVRQAGSDCSNIPRRMSLKLCSSPPLDLGALKTVLPDSNEWSGTVLAVVHENDPALVSIIPCI